MALISTPEVRTTWAESGNTLEPATETQEIGFIVEKPPYEVVNWLHYIEQNDLNYIFQEGIATWNYERDYSGTSTIQYAGKVYKSKLPNKNKQPDKFPDIWQIAFADNNTFLDLSKEVNNIKNSDGYLPLVVYQKNPKASARFQGTSYSANIGLPLAQNSNNGYVFNNYNTSGLAHDGTSPVMLNNGQVVAQFKPVLNVNESSKTVVTMDVLQKYLQQYPIGSIFLSVLPDDPSKQLGYGKWARYAEGRAIVGFNSSVSNNFPEWTKIAGGTSGTYTHTLSTSEIPSHNHGYHKPLYNYGHKDGATDNTRYGDEQLIDNAQTSSVGGNQPHNNVQPSIVIYVWRRTS